jgi:hypothetical protein
LPQELVGATYYDKLLDFDKKLFDVANSNPKHYDYFSYIVYSMDTTNHQYKVATYVNGTSQDAIAIAPTFFYEAILRQATGNN